VLVEIDVVFEFDAVEIGEHRHLRLRRLISFCVRAQILDQSLGVDLFLDVNRHHVHGKVFRVLFILTLPNKLRVKRWVPWIKQRLRGLLVLRHEAAQFLGRNVGPLILVRNRFDFDGLFGGRLLWRHGGLGD
jgi:hypothetical protein